MWAVVLAWAYTMCLRQRCNNKKFREAQALLANGGCREIHSAADFAAIMDRFLSDKDELSRAGQAADDYIKQNAGATAVIAKDTLGR